MVAVHLNAVSSSYLRFSMIGNAIYWSNLRCIRSEIRPDDLQFYRLMGTLRELFINRQFNSVSTFF